MSGPDKALHQHESLDESPSQFQKGAFNPPPRKALRGPLAPQAQT